VTALCGTLAKLDIKEQGRLSCWLQRLVRRITGVTCCVRSSDNPNKESPDHYRPDEQNDELVPGEETVVTAPAQG
jgi:hypothetical protein